MIQSGSLISAKHRELYRDYYAQRITPSRASSWLSRIDALAAQLQASAVIDYGCGAARGVSIFSRFDVIDYDPGVPECSALPAPADLVVSIHTLEHVEPDCVDAVIEHMQSLARLALLVVVSCEASTKLLPDGSAWHSFVRPASWWRARLSGFEEQTIIKDRAGSEFAALWRRPPA